MRLTEADLRILMTLKRFRFASWHELGIVAYPNQNERSQRVSVSRRLTHLRKEKLIHSAEMMGRKRVFFLTTKGADFMGVERNQVGVKLGEYLHDEAVLRLYFALQPREEIHNLITEREARAYAPAAPDTHDNPYALNIFRQDGKLGHAWPDLISGTENNLIGYEVEWTRKYKRRLLQLMIGYGQSDNYTAAIYFTNPTTHDYVTNIAYEANKTLHARGKGTPIAVRKLHDFIPTTNTALIA